MRVRVIRMGGIAGIRLQAEVDTSSLPAPPHDVAAALDGLCWGEERDDGARDGFRYEITRLDDAARTAPAVLPERDVPPALRGLLDAVRTRGEPPR